MVIEYSGSHCSDPSMRFFRELSILAIFSCCSPSTAIPTPETSLDTHVSTNILSQRRGGLLPETVPALTRRDIGIIDHNLRWRTHYNSITTTIPATAAAIACTKLLRFMVGAYIPRYQSRQPKNSVTAVLGNFQIIFASTQIINLADLGSYVEALLSSPIADELAGLWEVGYPCRFS